jgi:hypothetical protein
MVVGMSHLPSGMHSVAHFVIGKWSVEGTTVPLIQRLMRLETVNKVRIRSGNISLSLKQIGLHEVSSKSNEVACAAAYRLCKIIWTVSPS